MATVYAKLENGVMTYAPETIFVDGVKVTNPTHEMLVEAGYLPVKPTHAPNVSTSFIAVPSWEKTENEIVLTWRVIPDTTPLTESEVLSLLIPQQINTLDVDDNMALRMLDFYPEWAAGAAYTVGYKVRRDGKLWRVLQAHTSQVGWEPETAASLWEQINETHAGTMDDPIPYSGNMALTNGLYYMQDWVIYKCTRDTGNPVYHALSELVGLYVEKA